jgi:2-haloacid dehalogenase
MAIRALTFDVFGTVVDWRSSVIRQVSEVGASLGVEGDWAAFVDDWRYDGYIGGIGKVHRGELPFMTTDELHRRKLDQLVESHGLQALDEAARDDLNKAWHRLDPWPDTVSGLTRLKSKFIISTLSNGNVRLLVDMAKYGGLPWDCVLSADVVGAFKPDPRSYGGAAKFLDLDPSEVMMVAAHKADLKAAQKAGLQAAFIPRPFEAGPSRQPDLSFDDAFQYNANDFNDLATQLGCA